MFHREVSSLSIFNILFLISSSRFLSTLSCKSFIFQVVGLLKVIGKKGMWSNACEFLKLMIGLFSGIDITSF
ncbi:hypothetical protein ACFX16_024584 [Malus domestica]